MANFDKVVGSTVMLLFVMWSTTIELLSMWYAIIFTFKGSLNVRCSNGAVTLKLTSSAIVCFSNVIWSLPLLISNVYLFGGFGMKLENVPPIVRIAPPVIEYLVDESIYALMTMPTFGMSVMSDMS